MILRRIRRELFEDTRVDYLRRRYKDVSDQEFGERVGEAQAADPTRGKYLAWILTLVDNGDVILPEDAEKVHTRLSEFDQLKKKRSFRGERDINKYKSYAELAQVVKDNSDAKSKSELKRQLATDGAKLIKEEDFGEGNMRLYEITTCEAGLALGWRDTEWCVQNPKWFDKYGPPFYYLMKQDEKTGVWEPHQLLKMGGVDQNGEPLTQCMDVNDKPVGPFDFDYIGLDLTPLYRDVKYCSKLAKTEKMRITRAEPYFLETDNPRQLANVFTYAEEFVKQRWPELEQKAVHLIKDAEEVTDAEVYLAWAALGYTQIMRRSGGSWPELLDAVSTAAQKDDECFASQRVHEDINNLVFHVRNYVR